MPKKIRALINVPRLDFPKTLKLFGGGLLIFGVLHFVGTFITDWDRVISLVLTVSGIFLLVILTILKKLGVI